MWIWFWSGSEVLSVPIHLNKIQDNKKTMNKKKKIDSWNLTDVYVETCTGVKRVCVCGNTTTGCWLAVPVTGGTSAIAASVFPCPQALPVPPCSPPTWFPCPVDGNASDLHRCQPLMYSQHNRDNKEKKKTVIQAFNSSACCQTHRTCGSEGEDHLQYHKYQSWTPSAARSLETRMARLEAMLILAHEAEHCPQRNNGVSWLCLQGGVFH